MTTDDHAGNPISPARPDAVDVYAQALHETLCLRGDPVATIDRALAAKPASSPAT
jgi:hypothetical protein